MASTQTKKSTRARKPRARRGAARKRRSSGPLEPDAGVATFLDSIERGEPWYPTLLDVIGRWVAPEETVDGVHHRYLIAGEAFDWMRLAQRLLETVGERVAADEAERLLLFGLPPDGSDDEDFARAIGPQKHSAHLNFQYGVVVEEALLLSAEQELQKAGALSGSQIELADVAAYERVYGKPFEELMGMYRAETGSAVGEKMSLGEMQTFTYWCSKHRFRMGEPARVASDTRKALALLSTMEPGRARLAGRGVGAMPAEQPSGAVIEG